MLERAEVPEPRIAEEETTLAPTDKGIVVRGLTLAHRLALSPRGRKASTPQGDESEEEAQARGGMEVAAWQLERQVFLADGTPLYTAQEWLVYGASQQKEFVRVFDIASRLAGLSTEAAEKN